MKKDCKMDKLKSINNKKDFNCPNRAWNTNSSTLLF